MSLIINADDFGWNQANDSVIQSLFLDQAISSASLIVNGANTQNAAKYTII
jgi:predicted glycoside hydrolase/deacetylase ChbG (UPF0249 family)